MFFLYGWSICGALDEHGPISAGLMKKVNEASSLGQRGDVAGALIVLQSILKTNPTFMPAWMVQGQLFEATGDRQEALRCYLRALALAPNNSQMLLKVGVAELLLGNHDEAVRVLYHSHSLHPRNGETLYYLAQAYHLNGKDDLALKIIRECLRVDAANPSVWQKYGELLCSVKNYQEGLPWLLKSQRADPSLDRIDLELGRAFYNSMDLPNAATYLERAADRQSNDLRTLSLLAVTYTQLSRWQDARTMFERIIAIQADNVLALSGLGQCEVELKDYQGAAASLERVLSLDPTQIAAHFFLSKAYNGLGRTEAAQHEAALHHTMMDHVSFSPPEAKRVEEKAVWDRARNYLLANQEETALRVLQEASKGPSAQSASPYVFLGALYLTLGRSDDASRNLAHAFAIDPKVKGVRTYRGILALQSGDLDRAESEFTAELASDPNHQLAMAELGEVRYRQGRWAEAADQIAQSKTRIPTLLYLLCDSYFRLGKTSQANLTAEVLVAYARDDPEALQPLAVLLEQNHQAATAQQVRDSIRQSKP